jgi:site-specific DNA-cytosine methylase
MANQQGGSAQEGLLLAAMVPAGLPEPVPMDHLERPSSSPSHSSLLAYEAAVQPPSPAATMANQQGAGNVNWEAAFQWAHQCVRLLAEAAAQNPVLRSTLLWTGNLPISSSYSGLHTDCRAAEMIQAAVKQCSLAASQGLQFSYTCVSACDRDKHCQQVIMDHIASDPEAHVYTDILNLLPPAALEQVHEIESTREHPWDELKEVIASVDFAHKVQCAKHTLQACEHLTGLLEVSGSNCQNYSTRGKRTGKQGEHGKVLLTWSCLHKRRGTPLIVHENVRTFDGVALEELFGDEYTVTAIPVAPEDAGVTILDRTRMYHILAHKEKASIVGDILATYQATLSICFLPCHVQRNTHFTHATPAKSLPMCREALADHLRSTTKLTIKDIYLEHTEAELLQEMKRACNSRSEAYTQKANLLPYLDDWEPLLSNWERKNLQSYCQLWRKERKMDPHKDPSALFVLSQSADGWATMTTAKGRVPCYTHGSSMRVYSPYKRRWLTAREKLNSMLFPVVPQYASIAGVGPMDMSNLEDGHRMVGNAMHLGNLGVVLLAALSNVRLVDRSALQACPDLAPLLAEPMLPESAMRAPGTPSAGRPLPPGVQWHHKQRCYTVVAVGSDLVDKCDFMVSSVVSHETALEAAVAYSEVIQSAVASFASRYNHKELYNLVKLTVGGGASRLKKQDLAARLAFRENNPPVLPQANESAGSSVEDLSGIMCADADADSPDTAPIARATSSVDITQSFLEAPECIAAQGNQELPSTTRPDESSVHMGVFVYNCFVNNQEKPCNVKKPIMGYILGEAIELKTKRRLDQCRPFQPPSNLLHAHAPSHTLSI